MTDYGLLISVLAALAVAGAVCKVRWQLRTTNRGTGFVDAVLGAAAVGLVVGRLTTVAIDDPGAVRDVADLLVLGAGVEFWPGVLGAWIAVAWSARRDGVDALERIADLAPLAMLAYGTYELGCLVRGGCYGPRSAIGLRPAGFMAAMVPVGAILGLVVAAASVAVHVLSRGPARPIVPILTGLWVVAAGRSVASFWLPRLGPALTRQHVTSLLMGVASSLALTGYGIAHVRRRRAAT